MQFDDLTYASAPCGAGPGMQPAAQPRIEIQHRSLAERMPADGVLAVVRFGAATPAADDGPLTVGVQLTPLRSEAAVELWLANGTVRSGRAGLLRYAHDEHFLFATLEMDEREHGGILRAAEVAYAAINRFQSACDFPQVLRMWNYLDAINEGAGDLERYRQFCVGRARGLGDAARGPHPAATAVGHQHATHILQVCWLAGRAPGIPIENPRQVSAYRYPRVHGPVSPGFSRATLAGDGTLLISGTASIVGHTSQHPSDAREQLEEILRNLDALVAHAQRQQAAAARHLLKVYVRDPALADFVDSRLQQIHPGNDAIFLAADVCRRELSVEIESVRL